ncbi:hypothetical protein G4B88_001073 [Cannabis sativa]|uniref:DUF4283 domain-containing protein n=1 Tax=Cannabis sativa TaxID=3483 RepID=A0A7J6EDI0_CANSA|nr:hypothetical protein G4B88_001073 [Cannabis sativa]
MHTRRFHGPTGHGLHRNPTSFGKKKGQYPTGFDWKYNFDPLADQKLRKYWSFHTKYKVFMVTLTHDGGSVRICERTRYFGYEITITIDVVDWIIETVKEVQQKEERQRASFKRSFRNSFGSWFLECFLNIKGSFLKLSALRNNKLKSVIIPEEEKAKGWSELLRCLNKTMKREQVSVNDNYVQQSGETKSRGSLNQRSWINVAKETWKPMAKQPVQMRNAFSKATGRRKGDIEWELGRKLVVSQMFDDRCIVWCKDEKERDGLIQAQKVRVLGSNSVVSFSPWSWESQKENIKIECRDSWIGIYSLPLNLWHMKIFRSISDCCGGLLDVDKETAEATMLSHLRLQLMGD